MNEIQRMITALSAGEPLQHEDWLRLITDASEEDRRFSRDLACKRAQARFGRRVFFRGIIEFTNYCKNDCYYCGIRKSNRRASPPLSAVVMGANSRGESSSVIYAAPFCVPDTMRTLC